MNLSECYQIIGLSEKATDEEIKKSFKMLAHKYHPDKNPHRVQWANEAMSTLNMAYTTLMQFRFHEDKKESIKNAPEPMRAQTYEANRHTAFHVKKERTKKKYYEPNKERKVSIDPDILTKEFVKIRESVKNELYRYFQYGIYNIARRENAANRNIYDNIVVSLKGSYHDIINLENKTDDEDFIKHFDVFSLLVYNFYMSSECVNVIDFYSDAVKIEPYRMFKKGDDTLHPCEKEIFFDRHNRGSFKKNIVDDLLAKSEQYFNNMLKMFPDSTWAIETKIKLQYTLSLKGYLNLFFSEYAVR